MLGGLERLTGAFGQPMDRILIVDDDESFRSALRRALSQAGFDVEIAVDGKDGVRKFRAGNFGLVIVDIFMPEQDGLETLMEIRRNTPGAKVIAISGHGTESLEVAKRLGAVGALTKPFQLADLLSVMRQALDPGASPGPEKQP